MSSAPDPDTPAGTAADSLAEGRQAAADDRPEVVLSTTAEYTLGDELARGGGGRVLRAWDKRLGREVVVKAPIPGRSHARMAREALITAQLEHPAIVPVHAAGQLPDGTPYYVMRLVAGGPLSQAIAASRSLTERLALVPVAVTVAEAVAYAHSRDIIHRDLKPQNVLVGPFGEVSVIDWGLAKGLGEDDPLDAGEFVVEDERATRLGAVVGTPAYMPPEQARGEPVDKRSDVYALGALLYHVFAGVPPLSGGDSKDVVRRAAAGEIPPLETHVPRVPVELAAIVRRAMAIDPADRYPTARELADDLRRFQTGQLVAAHAYSAPALIWRWVRRHRAPVAVALLALVALGVGGALAVGRVVREKGRADRQRAAAEALVQFVLVDLRERLRKVGKLELLDGVSTQVEGYYESLEAAGAPLDAVAQRRKAEALAVLGTVRHAQGNTAAGLAALRASVEIYRAVVHAAPAPERLVELAKALVALGEEEMLASQFDTGHAEEALVAAEAALAQAPGDAKALLAKAGALRGLARRAGQRGERAQGIELYDKELALLEPLARADPDDEEVARLAVQAYREEANEMAGMNRGDAAVTRAEAARALAERFSKRAPADVEWERRLAMAEHDVGRAQVLAGRTLEAIPHDQRALAIHERLAARDPQNLDWLGGVAEVNVSLAEALLKTDKAKAREHGRRAIALYEQLAAAQPENRRWPAWLGSAYGFAGELERRDQPAEALRLYRAAVGVQERILQREPDNKRAQVERSSGLMRVGETELRLGQREAGRRDLEAVVAALEPVVRDRPTFNSRNSLAMTHAILADDLGLDPPGDAALAHLRRCIAIEAAIAEENPGLAQARGRLGWCHGRVGLILGRDPARAADARAELAQGEALMAAVAAEGRLDAEYAPDLPRVRAALRGR